MTSARMPRPFRGFRPGESHAKGFLRILKRLAAEVKRANGSSPGPKSDPVHQTRVLVKRLRALLWLAGSAISPPEKNRIQSQLRQASHLLAPQRDQEVTQSLLKKLAQPPDGIARKPKRAKGTEPAQDTNAAQRASSLLLLALRDFTIQARTTTKWPSRQARLAKACRATKKAGKKALKTELPARFHDWRKKAKRLLYLLQWNRSACGEHIALLIKRVDKLQRRLGAYHDCVIAEEHLMKNSSDKDEVERTIKQLQKRGSRLQKAVRKLYGKLGSIKP